MKIVKITKNKCEWLYAKNEITVKTPDGSRNIDKIWFNGFVKPLELFFVNDKDEVYSIKCTDKHKFLSVHHGWVTAEDMINGYIFDNNWIFSHALQLEDLFPTFDIEVPEEHAYILESGIVSHNSNSQLSGGVSQGIEPIIANVYQQKTAAGTVYRISPKLLEIMKAKGIYTQELVDDIGMNWDGSVQHVDWLTAHEKMVFKTAYEINQETIIDLAADRQKYIDQAQSINLFFKADADEAEIARVHMNAMFNPWIKSLYYMRSQPTSKGSTGVSEKKEEVGCVSCEA